MWAVDPTRLAALTVLALIAALLALACSGRSAESPDVSADENGGGKARSLKVMSANIYLGARRTGRAWTV